MVKESHASRKSMKIITIFYVACNMSKGDNWALGQGGTPDLGHHQQAEVWLGHGG